jgi:PAS domain-containing protein
VRRFSAIAPAVVIAVGLYLISLFNYLLFHSLVELFALVIAFGIFMIAWNSRKFIDNNYLLFLGISCFFVGIFDIGHTLAYKGMNIFPGEGSNLATQLWIAGRYLQGASLFAAPFFIDRRLRPDTVFLVYTVVSAVLMISIFGGMFPVSFIDNAGLTRFKIISEYLVIALLILSVMILLRHRERFDRKVLRFIVGSIICTAFSEMALTLYVDVYGVWNLVGHYFKLASYYLIYRAMIKTGLKEPYSLILRGLKQSEDRLLAAKNRAETYLHIAGTLFVVIGSSEAILLINRRGCEILGCAEEKVVGRNWFEAFIPMMDRKEERSFFSRFL